MNKEKMFEENMNLVPYVIKEMLHIDMKEFDYEDLLQEGYICLWNAIKTYDKNNKSSFSNYACCCIKNRLVNYLNKPRRVYHREQYLLDLSLDKEVDEKNHIAFHEVMGVKQERDLNLYIALKDVLKSLDKNDIKTKILFDKIKGYTRKEIAQKYNMSFNTVNAYLSKIRKEIKSKLD